MSVRQHKTICIFASKFAFAPRGGGGCGGRFERCNIPTPWGTNSQLRTFSGGRSEPSQRPHFFQCWVGWAQQPWLAASLGEGQLRIETHECQVCWTGLTCYQGSGPVLRTYTGGNTLPPSTSLPVMGEIAGVNTASLGGYLYGTKTRARWAEGFHELNGHVFDLERDGLRQVVLCPRLTMR